MSGWSWLVLGGVLLLLEAVTPGVAMIWLAISAGLTGLVVLIEPALPWQWQLVLFSGCSLASVAGWLWYRHRHPPRDGDPNLNQRSRSYVGQEAVLTVATGLGHGRVRVADGSWPADGPALPAGSRVRIVGARGAVLLVEPAEGAPEPE